MYEQKQILINQKVTTFIKPGVWLYLTVEVKSRLGFLVWVNVTAGDGVLSVMLKNGKFPEKEGDYEKYEDDAASSTLHVRNCRNCYLRHVPHDSAVRLGTLLRSVAKPSQPDNVFADAGHIHL